MSAEILRAAAERLDEAIDRLSTDTAVWDEQFPVVNVYADQSSYGRLIMHPEVGKALAAWLRQAARDEWAHGRPECCAGGCDECDDDLLAPHLRRALTLANLILGGSDD